MKYCSHCGNEVIDGAVICVNCGCSVANLKPKQPTYPNNRNLPVSEVNIDNSSSTQSVCSDQSDTSSIGLNILSFLIPLVGLILYLAKKENYPIKSKKIGIATIIGVIINCIILIFIYSFLLVTAEFF